MKPNILDSKDKKGITHFVAKILRNCAWIFGGAALIALTFLPITTALAGIIGAPAILLKIICSVIGAFMALKGGMSMKKDYSKIECILARRECDYIYYHSKANSRRKELATWITPKIAGDVTCKTADACFGKIE